MDFYASTTLARVLPHDCDQPQTFDVTYPNKITRDMDLTIAAYRRLVDNMARYGNRLTEDHQTALMRIVGRFTHLANGASRGRIAFDLPCGGGKSQAIVAWCAALIEAGLPYSIAVCASRVEPLCDMKRDMIANGVPEAAIGLLHSYTYDAAKAEQALSSGQPLPDGYASEPATTDNDRRRIVLATHARVRGKTSPEAYNLYLGRKRDLVVWDESLIIASHRAIARLDIEQGLGWLKPLVRDGRASADLSAAMDYVGAAWEALEAELRHQQKGGQPRSVVLPPLDAEQLQRFVQAIPDREPGEPVRQLLAISQSPLRVVAGQQGGGYVQYEVVVPPELTNVAVLDASWAIRDLERLDRSIKEDPAFRGDVKGYNNVTVHHLRAASGRQAMTNDFAKRREDRKVSREVVEVVRAIPAEEAIIVFTFKPRARQVNMAEVLRGDLAAAGVDPDILLPCGKPRFVWLTWGQETSVSAFKYATNVVFAGVLHRSMVDLAGAMVGQMDHLTADISSPDLTKVRRSEVAYGLHQAMNRSVMRDTLDGEAKAAKVWLIHSELEVRTLLAKAMPGIKFEDWIPVAMEARTTKAEETARAIEGYLRGLASGIFKVSLKCLRAALDLPGVSPRTFGLAVAEAVAEGWTRQGRSFVRV